jgi:DNA-binding NtrC family response regulator
MQCSVCAEIVPLRTTCRETAPQRRAQTDKLQLAGNVRELQNLIERVVVLAEGSAAQIDNSTLQTEKARSSDR